MSKRKLSILLIFMTFLISVFSFSVQAEQAEVIVLKFNDQNPATSAHGIFEINFAELVEEKTECVFRSIRTAIPKASGH